MVGHRSRGAADNHRETILSSTLSLQDRYAPRNACFGCGPVNDKGLRIKSHVVADASGGEMVVCTWVPEKHHEAFDGMLNGGICGALLDCHSNWTAAHALMKQAGSDEPPCTVTAEFLVKLKRPTPTTTGPLRLVAHVLEIGSDRCTVEATLEAKMPDGQTKITATCRGIFIAVKEGHPAFHRW